MSLIRRTCYDLKLFLLHDFIVFFDAEKNLLVYFVLHFSSIIHTIIDIHHNILQSGSTKSTIQKYFIEFLSIYMQKKDFQNLQ